MNKNRTRYTSEFKKKVAIEAIKEQKTLNEIAGLYQIHPNQVSKWKAQLLEGAAEIFEDGRKKKKEDKPSEPELYQQIGQLQVELDWLKKNQDVSVSVRRKGIGQPGGTSDPDRETVNYQSPKLEQGKQLGSSYVLIQWQDLFTPGLLTPNMFIEKVFLQGVNDAYITGQSFLKTAGFLDRPILTIDGFMVNDKERTAACMNTLTNITTGLIGGWLKGTGNAAAQTYNFGRTPAAHMSNPQRSVPVQILDKAIQSTRGFPDPRGSRALMHYSTMWKNGKMYNLEVLYDKVSNSIWHFEYTQKPLGPLPGVK